MESRAIHNEQNFCFCIVWLQFLFFLKNSVKLLESHEDCGNAECRTCLIRQAYIIYKGTEKNQVVRIPRELMNKLALNPSTQEDPTEQFLQMCGDDVAAVLNDEYTHKVLYTVLRSFF
jgi:hypothetical protein